MPVDAQGNIRKDLIEWMRTKDAPPFSDYDNAFKVPLGDLISDIPTEQLEQLALFPQDSFLLGVGGNPRGLHHLDEWRRLRPGLSEYSNMSEGFNPLLDLLGIESRWWFRSHRHGKSSLPPRYDRPEGERETKRARANCWPSWGRWPPKPTAACWWIRPITIGRGCWCTLTPPTPTR